MSREWEEVNISETIISSNTGLDAIKRAPIVDYDSGIKCLRIQDISQGKDFKEWGFCGVEEKNYSRFQLKKGDIIVARTGATIGVNKIIKKDLKSVFNNGLIRIKVNGSIIDYNYLYYNMQSYAYKGHIQSICAGTSTQPNMKMNDLLKFKIKLPPLDEQKTIAHILSTLDEKIETNNQINKKLEEMAQAIFKHWFVDFEFPNEDGEPYKSSGGEMVESELGMIPKGWEVGKFENLVTVKYGKDHKKLEDGDIPVYGSGGIMRYVNKSLYSSESVLIPRKGTLNNVIYINEPFWSVDTMFFTQMNYPNITKYIYFFIKDKDLLSMNSGSAVPSMTTNILNQLPMIASPLKLIQRFNKLVEPVFLHMDFNDKETRKLSDLRDLLLPKLMSGEIRVPLKGDDLK